MEVKSGQEVANRSLTAQGQRESAPPTLDFTNPILHAYRTSSFSSLTNRAQKDASMSAK